MFFYLKWIDRRPIIPIITQQKPSNLNFSSQFKIGKKEFTICGQINEKFTEYYPDKKIYYSKYQYLQSHLQKCIRRMDSIKSVKTAKHLIDINIVSFLRRLPIIMLEDVTIHESISIIIWLMIAVSKGYKIRYDMIKWLLGVVYHLSNDINKTIYNNKNIPVVEINMEHPNKNILYSLFFRKAFGGMNGDMNMIQYYINTIQENNIIIQKDKIPLIKICMEPLDKKEWIYQANDFHCNKYILNCIKRFVSFLAF